jgi:hypothetical protein
VSDPLLPDTTTDEGTVGWGDEVYDDTVGDEAERDEARLRAERPPHHDRD